MLYPPTLLGKGHEIKANPREEHARILREMRFEEDNTAPAKSTMSPQRLEEDDHGTDKERTEQERLMKKTNTVPTNSTMSS